MKWIKKTMDDLAEIIMGQSPPSEFYNETGNGIPFFQGKTEFGRLYPSVKKYTSKITREAKAGDILFTVRAPVGDINIANFVCCIGRGVAAIRSKENNMFLFYLIKNSKDKFLSKSGGTVYDSINRDDLLKISFDIPEDRKYRAKIASVLSAYDDLIENNLRRIKLLEEAARLIYKEWFVRLRFPGHEHTRIVDGLPEGWKNSIVKDFGEILTGKTPSTKRSEYYGNDIPFIKIPDMHGNVFVIKTDQCLTKEGATTQNKKFIPKDSIVVSCIGTAGVVSLTSRTSQTNQQINSLIPFEKSYLYYCYFTFKDLKEYMEAIGSNGATMVNVNKGKFEQMPILKPSQKILQLFDKFCFPVFEKILNLQLMNEKLQEARDILLPRLMNGSIQV